MSELRDKLHEILCEVYEHGFQPTEGADAILKAVYEDLKEFKVSLYDPSMTPCESTYDHKFHREVLDSWRRKQGIEE